MQQTDIAASSFAVVLYVATYFAIKYTDFTNGYLLPQKMQRNQESTFKPALLDFVPVGRIEKTTQPYVLTTLMRLFPTPALTGESSIYSWTSPEGFTYPTALTSPFSSGRNSSISSTMSLAAVRTEFSNAELI